MRGMQAVAFATLVLASCAPLRPETVDVPPSDKTIAVVSSIPSQIRIATTGLTVFENALDVVGVPDWKLADVAADAATSQLSPYYTVVRASLNGPIVDSDTKLDKTFKDTWSIEDQVRQRIHTDRPVDLYLVISLGNAAQPYTGLPDVGVGIGVSKLRDPFRTRPPVVHTYLQMTVIDGRTQKLIATRPLEHSPSPSGELFGGTVATPTEPLNGFEWKDYWHEMSDAQQDLIRDRIKALLASSVAYTMREMRLIPASAVASGHPE
jgi:hypothetical protein